jgi:3-hydroxybutyryl-CoA dehydrogenase
VEVISGEATDPDISHRVAALMKSLDKVPVIVKKDIPGFLANRIQHAMMREAFSLLDAGMASAEDIDAAITYGFGLRLLAAGPILQKDIAGLELHYAAAETIYPHLANNSMPSKALAGLVGEGKFGMKTGEGFYKWTPQSAAKEKARYDRVLLAALAILKSESKKV